MDAGKHCLQAFKLDSVPHLQQQRESEALPSTACMAVSPDHDGVVVSYTVHSTVG